MIRIKQVLMLAITICLSAFTFQRSYGQATEIQQLLLNVEKLAQFKAILSDMKKGYTILSTGYNSVKNIAQGNFSLHETFLDGLMLVSPEIRRYYRIADIITDQSSIVSEYSSAYKRFNAGGNFNASEMNYLGKVYSQLFKQSLENLDGLILVITVNKLRMSDDERLRAIYGIAADTQDKLIFLRSFNRQTDILNIQRQKERNDLSGTAKYYNLN